MTRILKFNLAAACITVVIASVILLGGAHRDGPAYRVAEVSLGAVKSSVSASGTLKPLITVDVGTQVSGLIKALHADFNDEVEAGQVIARIDSASFEAMLSQAEAGLAVAEARVVVEESSLAEHEAQLVAYRAGQVEARHDVERKRSMLARGSLSSSVVDTAVAKFGQADARVTAGVARLKGARAQIELARAQVLREAAIVEQRKLDLGYSYIRSPVKGVVISRNVDVGQTVAASLQAPVLFRIAQDLDRMEVNINIDEADIGGVRAGQAVFFSVDAFPQRAYEGRVEQIRKAGLEISNVVMYTVVASATNADHSLLPGMTANVSIIVDERNSALRVPTAALRLRLPVDIETPPANGSWVWVMEGSGQPKLVAVESGISNGDFSEIVGGALTEGQKVILGLASPTTP